MPLDPVLVLVVVDHEAGLVIPLLQTLHSHPSVILVNVKYKKTKYFVLRLFDEVCSDYNEVNEEAESKRQETPERLPRDFRETSERLLRDF